MAITQSDDAYLLSLPMELLQRITSSVDQQEVVPYLRLTCKALEAATFDLFVATFVKEVHCCVIDRSRLVRLSKLLRNSSRLSRMVRNVTFTTYLLKGKHVADIQLAPAKNTKDFFHEQLNHLRAYGVPKEVSLRRRQGYDAAFMTELLLDLKEKSPKAKVCYDLSRNRLSGFGRVFVHRNLLRASIESATRLYGLELSLPCLQRLGSLLAREMSDLRESFSSLRSFALCEDYHTFERPSYPVKSLDFVVNILAHTPKLRHLALNLRSLATIEGAQLSQDITTKVLSACLDYQLTDLRLTYMVLSEDLLLKALRQSKPKLKLLILDHVRILRASEAWSGVMREIAALPELGWLSLHELCVGDMVRPGEFVLNLEHTTHGKIESKSRGMPKVVFLNKEQVMMGLKELLAQPLTYKSYRRR